MIQRTLGVLPRLCACVQHRQQTCARQAVAGTDFCVDCCPVYCCCSCTACEVTLCGVSPDVSPRTTSRRRRLANVSPRTACIAVLSADVLHPVRMSQRWCCRRTPPPWSRHCRRPWWSLCGSLRVPAHVAFVLADTISRHALGRLWVGPTSAQTASALTVVVHAHIAR